MALSDEIDSVVFLADIQYEFLSEIMWALEIIQKHRRDDGAVFMHIFDLRSAVHGLKRLTTVLRNSCFVDDKMMITDTLEARFPQTLTPIKCGNFYCLTALEAIEWWVESVVDADDITHGNDQKLEFDDVLKECRQLWSRTRHMTFDRIMWLQASISREMWMLYSLDTSKRPPSSLSRHRHIARRGTPGLKPDEAKQEHAEHANKLRSRKPQPSWPECAEKVNKKFNLVVADEYTGEELRKLHYEKYKRKTTTRG